MIPFLAIPGAEASRVPTSKSLFGLQHNLQGLPSRCVDGKCTCGDTRPLDTAGEPQPIDAAGEPQPMDAAGEPEPIDTAGEPEPVDAAGEPQPVDAAGEPDQHKRFENRLIIKKIK